MSDVLARICNEKREHIAQSMAVCSLTKVEARAQVASAPRGFARKLRSALARREYGLIAEIKKAALVRQRSSQKSRRRHHLKG